MKRLYDRIHRHYGLIERSLGPTLEKVMRSGFMEIPGARDKTALDYACGSGLLTLILAAMFGSVEGVDSSAGMLGRARERAAGAGKDIIFREGNILEADEPAGSRDYVFVSFALHLFSPEDVTCILNRLANVAREAVVVIDHGRRWNLLTALVEWFEGSHYGPFIKQDFSVVATAIGARGFEEREIEGCMVLIFIK